MVKVSKKCWYKVASALMIANSDNQEKLVYKKEYQQITMTD